MYFLRLILDLRDLRDREKEKEDEERRKRREDRNKNRDPPPPYIHKILIFLEINAIFHVYFSVSNVMDLPGGLTPNLDDRRKSGFSGFGGRKDSDSEEDEPKAMTRVPGAAIAPPPSLQESFVSSPSSGPQQSTGVGMGMGVAAKIMAKYGFKVTKFVYLKNVFSIYFINHNFYIL